MLKTFRKWAQGGIIAGLMTVALLASVNPAKAQPPATQVYWMCTLYLFGLQVQQGIVVTDGGYPDGGDGIPGWPYSVWCQYLFQCDTVFNENGVYETRCN